MRRFREDGSSGSLLFSAGVSDTELRLPRIEFVLAE